MKIVNTEKEVALEWRKIMYVCMKKYLHMFVYELCPFSNKEKEFLSTLLEYLGRLPPGA